MFRLLMLMLIWPSVAQAFCLAPKLRADDEYFMSDAVLIGTVLSEHKVVAMDDPGSYEATVYRVRIERTLRGHLREFASIYSENNSGRFPMLVRRRYLLFAHHAEQGLVINYCGNSGLLSKSKPALEEVKQIATRSYGLLYGETIRCEHPQDCGQMTVIAIGQSGQYTGELSPEGRFLLRVSPGMYRVQVTSPKREISTYDLPYRDPDCVTVPRGGSAGVAFAPKNTVPTGLWPTLGHCSRESQRTSK